MEPNAELDQPSLSPTYRVTFNDANISQEIESIARRKGLKPAQLIRMLALERLEQVRVPVGV